MTFRHLFRVAPLIFVSLACAAPAARTPEPAPEDKEVSVARVAGAIRDAVLLRYADWTPEDRETITAKQPMVAKYFLAGRTGQFYYSWDVSGDRTVVATYTGDVRQVDASRIEIRRAKE